MDADPWGHSVKALIIQFPRNRELAGLEDLIDLAGLLDQFYIPTRYPNGLPDLTPGQVYSRKDGERAIGAAQTILSSCETWMQSYRP